MHITADGYRAIARSRRRAVQDQARFGPEVVFGRARRV